MSNFKDILRDMQERGMKVPNDKVTIQIPQAETIFHNAMSYFLTLEGVRYEPQQEYSKIIDWLKDNQGKGLFMYGNCGRGKTKLSRYVLPAIILKYCRRIVSYYDVTELDTKVDEALKRHLLSIDDIGTETVAVNYGKKRMPFAEIMDAVEKSDKLIIITSNLNGEDLAEKYGERVIDRIRSTCVRVPFVGASLRK